MAGTDRTLALLQLFTEDAPAWTAEAIAAALGVSVSSAYRYVAGLEEAGFLAREAGGGYGLGPAFIQYDRQIQKTDPLLRAARPVMTELAALAPEGTTVVLCRAFGDRVLCVDQVVGRGPQPLVSYERGRPMPLFRGATSKVILAHLPARRLRALHARDAAAVRAAGLGEDWEAFRAALAAIRRAGHAVTREEIDAGRCGIAVPILDAERRVLGSLSFVATAAKVDAPRIARLATLLAGAAREIEGMMRDPAAREDAA